LPVPPFPLATEIITYPLSIFTPHWGQLML
jgi:hypothetical protein